MLNELDVKIWVQSTNTSLSEVHSKLSELYKQANRPQKFDIEVTNKRILRADRKRLGLLGELEIYNMFIKDELYFKTTDEQIKYLEELLHKLRVERRPLEGSERDFANGKSRGVKSALDFVLFLRNMTVKG